MYTFKRGPTFTKLEFRESDVSPAVILLPAHLHLLLTICLWDGKFLFQRVPGCNGIADLS